MDIVHGCFAFQIQIDAILDCKKDLVKESFNVNFESVQNFSEDVTSHCSID